MYFDFGAAFYFPTKKNVRTRLLYRETDKILHTFDLVAPLTDFSKLEPTIVGGCVGMLFSAGLRCEVGHDTACSAMVEQ